MCEPDEKEEHWFMKLLAFLALVLVFAVFASSARAAPSAPPLSTARAHQAVADARARVSSANEIVKSLEALAAHQKMDPSKFAGVRAHAAIHEAHAVELDKRRTELEAACTEYGEDHRECKRHRMLFAKAHLEALQHGHAFKEKYDQILSVAAPAARAAEALARGHRPHKPIFPRPHPHP